ncbi:RASEF protein, partial [Eubucco bourcierii]|nr:RASEF protein [Eubucco bourcierii]
MDPDAVGDDLSRLRALFLACDASGSGRIEREDFAALCAELRVRPAEAEAIFQRLDSDCDGAITFPEFARGFRGATRRQPGGGEPEGEEETAAVALATAGLEQPWRDFEVRLGDEARYIPRQEQVSVLYQNIHIVEPRLIQPYEHVIKNFIREIKLQSTEMETLAIAVKRAQDKAAVQLSELEEEMEQRIQAAEHKVKKEEKRKAEEALNELKRQYDTEVGDLQVTIKKLKKASGHSEGLEDQSKTINHREDVAELKKRMHDMFLENQKLKKDLLEAQTNIAFLQSELDTLKSEYADQTLNNERDLEMIREYTEERDNLERQIEILQSANRKLHDSNDGLRSALENSFSKFNRSLRLTNNSPGSTISRSSPKSNGGQSPLNTRYDRSSHSSCVDEDYDSLALCDPMQRINYEVDSLPESCFDSGLSTLRDSNEYDSEVECRQRIFQRSQCMQEGFGGDASDTDVPEIKDEETYSPDNSSTVLDWKSSQPVSRSSSVASTRKYISALAPQSDARECTPKYPSSEKAYKIVLAGDAAVGKSSFLMRLCKNEFRGNTSATLGVDFQMKRLIVDGEPTVLQLWDTAGQERRADGVLLLYDITCEKSFLNVREWMDMIEDAAYENIPIMMVGNKADLRQALTEQGHKCLPTNYGEKLAMTYNALFCETSAKDGSNIVEAVLHLAREVRKRSDNQDDRRSVTSLAGTPVKKSALMKNCCNV